jgi:D5 N terminal like
VTARDDITADPTANGQPPDVRRDELRDDIANADRYAAEHADRLRHVAAFSPPWRVWDGARWAADETGEHIEDAKHTADRLLSEAAAMGDKWPKHAAATRRAGRLRAMVNLAASDPRLARRARDFDSDPWLLNTPTGTLDLRTMELRPHDPADGLTMLTGAAYRPGVQAPTWRAFLDRILGHNTELESFLRRLVGLSAIGAVREHILAILWGAGANGNHGSQRAHVRARRLRARRHRRAPPRTPQARKRHPRRGRPPRPTPRDRRRNPRGRQARRRTRQGAHCTELVPQAFTPTSTLRASYAEWAKGNGSEELTSKALTERLSRRPLRGITLTRRNRARGWKGDPSRRRRPRKVTQVTNVTPSCTSLSHARAREEGVQPAVTCVTASPLSTRPAVTPALTFSLPARKGLRLRPARTPPCYGVMSRT